MVFSKSISDYVHKLGVDPHAINSSDGDAQAPAVALDTHHPLSHYFISSSHNTYLSGNQLYGKATPEAYQKVLERGCRCIEIDVWDGEEFSSDSSSDDNTHKKPAVVDRVKKWRPDRIEPRVLHGHTATKECSFRDVVETIGLYAFKTSDMPLIVSLEIHTTHDQQLIMVEIMKEYWSDYLVENTGFDNSTALPDLEALRKKILIKVKYSDPSTTSAKTASPPTTKRSDSSGDESQAVSVSKGKIVAELGSMGVYTRSCHFSSFDQPEARYPTHVFSLSEQKISSISAKDPDKLFRHNKDYMLRAYPKGSRITSSNLDPAPFWRLGVQIAALNWQYLNEGMMLNYAMFNGTGGYVLKPAGYRNPSSHTMEKAAETGTLNLTIEVFSGQNLVPDHKKLKAYIKCELHVEEDEDVKGKGLPDDGQAKEGQYKQKTSSAKESRDPDFGGQKLNFANIRHVTEDLTFVRFKVMHDISFHRDELVGWACYRLKRLREGVRLIHLLDDEGNPTEGKLLVRVSKKFVPK
ncbi:PLC-like phosphodiesterase [Myriangium duriaei CBS 260.36]|uniref:Phosphoinositide phospholipase C n=1 Tax=Myriangium duriaei CBS 260.36 TaxID=1168546 RepID=A0A9P4IPM9_9PEZI|nr:PLC-like phosphodiesterase [Myriangium duriaei CBS 260.36]